MTYLERNKRLSLASPQCMLIVVMAKTVFHILGALKSPASELVMRLETQGEMLCDDNGTRFNKNEK